MNTSKIFKLTVQIILYSALTTFFVYFYLVDQMRDFIRGRTTITSRFENVSELEPPTLTVCVNPRFKLSVALDFGMNFSWYQSIPVSNTSSYGEQFSKLSYILNQDYKIKMAIVKSRYFELVLGNNALETWTFEIKEIQTALHGTCVAIVPKFVITETPFYWGLVLIPSPYLDKINEISKFIIYLTSNDSWHSLVPAEWPQYNPSVIKVDRNSRYYYPPKVTEYVYAEGVQNSEECMTESIKESDCQVKCSPGSLANLPKCKAVLDIDCVWNSTMEAISRCNRRKYGLTFYGDLEQLENYQNENNETSVNIFVNALSKEVKEEVDVITTSGFIGSVGGSLGMFFGFSISAYVLNISNSIIRKFNAQ